MTMTERSTVVGVFPTREQAEQAINELYNLGLTDNQIGYAVRDTTGNTQGEITPADTHTGHHAAAGAISGGVIGGVIGVAASLLIPGLGPAIAGGILVATIGGVALGAAAGGLIGALTELGVPEEEARYYQNEFEAGRTIVTVNAPGFEQQQEVLMTLRHNGAYDANTQQEYVDTLDMEQPYSQSAQTLNNSVANEPVLQSRNSHKQANSKSATDELLQQGNKSIARESYERPNN